MREKMTGVLRQLSAWRPVSCDFPAEVFPAAGEQLHLLPPGLPSNNLWLTLLVRISQSQISYGLLFTWTLR